MKPYAKSENNQGYIKNLKFLAYNDLEGSSIFQPQLYRNKEGEYYLYGTIGEKIGILNVTNPENPFFIKKIGVVYEYC